MTGLHAHLRAVLRHVVEGGEAPAPLEDDGAPAGAFVALESAGALRGFVGTVAPRGPLAVTAAEMVRRAATEDGRFPPLGAPGDVGITVWRVGAARTIHGPGDLVPGRDGVLVREGFHRSVHLPGRGDEDDPEAFLESACLGAGLSPDAWSRPGVEVVAFEVDRIPETDTPPDGGS